MEKKLFFLEHGNTRFTKVFQIILGILCFIIALYWLIFNFQAFKTESRLWITIVFLILFGVWEILAGSGRTRKYISTEAGKIVLKQNSVLPPVELKPADLEKIELFPLSISFKMKNRSSIMFRFGLSFTEIIEPVRNEIIEFAGINSIPAEIKDEEL
ncbi:MAG: hypothetical protein V1903_04900 [Bacteroidota bacterium]